MRDRKTLWLFLLPGLAGLTVFYCVPLLMSLYYSLLDNMAARRFVGLQNFIEMLQNPVFRLGAANTGRLMLAALPVSILLALVAALWVERARFAGPATLVLLLPAVLPSAAGAAFWERIFAQDGILSTVLKLCGAGPADWQNGEHAILTAAAIFVWKYTGLFALILAAALRRIPAEYYEAAEVEGANAWQRFARVTLAGLAPALFICALLGVAGSFRVFREIYILYGSYPGNGLYTLQHYMNNLFFSMDMQKLCTVSWLLFAAVGAAVCFLFLGQKKLSEDFVGYGDSSAARTGSKRKNIALTLFAAPALLPLLFTLARSFLDASGGLSLAQYRAVLLESPGLLRLFWNSVLIMLPILAGQVAVSVLGAYAFERMSWKRKEALFFVYILVMLMPPQVLLVPNHIVSVWLGIGGWAAVILPAIFSPLGAFVMRLQMRGFPKECIEAAQSEGAGEWRIFRDIVLPNVAPAIAVLGVLTFAECWNIIDPAIVFISEPWQEPLSAWFSELLAGGSAGFCAAVCVYTVPAVIAFGVLNGAASAASGEGPAAS